MLMGWAGGEQGADSPCALYRTKLPAAILTNPAAPAYKESLQLGWLALDFPSQKEPEEADGTLTGGARQS